MQELQEPQCLSRTRELLCHKQEASMRMGEENRPEIQAISGVQQVRQEDQEGFGQ